MLSRFVMATASRTRKSQLFLPQKDRSYWQPDSANMPLQYLAWGRRNFEQEYLPACPHQGWTGLLIQEGRPKITLNGEVIHLTRGTLALIGPDCLFGWPSLAENRCKFILWMWHQLDAGPLQAAPSGYSLVAPEKSYREALVLNHDLCRKEAQAMDDYSTDYLTACHLSFQVLLRRALENDTDRESNDTFARATEWIDEHLDSKNPIARLCDYLNISQSSLYRIFTERIEISPAEYFRNRKMEQARELIRRNDCQIKEVAHKLGYSQFNDFSRAYRQHYGKPPSDDR